MCWAIRAIATLAATVTVARPATSRSATLRGRRAPMSRMTIAMAIAVTAVVWPLGKIKCPYQSRPIRGLRSTSVITTALSVPPTVRVTPDQRRAKAPTPVTAASTIRERGG